MITVDQYRYIRTAHRVYGKTIREIVRDTGHSRNTVKRALREEYWGYHTRKTQPYPVLGPYWISLTDGFRETKTIPKSNAIRQEGSTIVSVMSMALRGVSGQ